ncbi:MAG: efflux RND transporter periplasmic adaptor subunit [Planctomycetota bacterium]|jgi:RND family efflux transporter MFP subunit
MPGVVAKVDVEKNENVAPGEVVVEMNSGKDLEVNVGVPESYISRVKEGERVKVKFSAVADRTFEGTISEVSYAISSESSTYPVSVLLDNPSEQLRPGMAADVTIQFKSSNGKEPRLVVPIKTVAEDQGGRFVFTVTENEDGLATVHKKAVKIGELMAGGLEITEGLEESEFIVTAGISKLSDGMTVKLLK